MRQLIVKPVIYQYDTCKAFIEAFEIGENDLIITNEHIFKPHFGGFDIKADVMLQEKYGLGEPSDEMAEAMYAGIKKDYKRIIAIGGGTVLDVSKLFALKNVSPVQDLFDRKLEIKKAKELVLVPTTCGTGSEVTNISILELKSRQTKLGLAVDELYADSAVLIPELLKGLPFAVFATSSIDALIHALESVLSPKATPFTELFGYEAIRMILTAYRVIARDGQDARMPMLKDFLIASAYAGISFGNAGCAAVHAMSYPLGGMYHVPHGEANYCMLIGVFNKYMSIDPAGKISRLNRFIANILECGESEVYAEMEKLLGSIILRKPLREYGVTGDDLKAFTENVMTRQGRLMGNNYAELTEKDVFDIYKELY
ncbi:MAG: 4-hydroxybutyrate dehydrogenase [Defluviitaleaceae bacterium]|nr:4-hydroxybutyrate dehydrogenase [Defluviitaleaceae bacterium]MCL2836388.1 4-hydroxybutyrate dehydrogenase [Defluviitaleaceae bacterium]